MFTKVKHARFRAIRVELSQGSKTNGELPSEYMRAARPRTDDPAGQVGLPFPRIASGEPERAVTA